MTGMTKLFYFEILRPSLLGFKFQSCHKLSNFCYAKNNWEYDVVADSGPWNTRAAIVKYYQNTHKKEYEITIFKNENIITKTNNIGHEHYSNNDVVTNRIKTHSVDKSKTDCLLGFVKDKARANRSGFGLHVAQMKWRARCFLLVSTSKHTKF